MKKKLNSLWPVMSRVLFVFFILGGGRSGCRKLPRLWSRQQANNESRHHATSENKTTVPPWISCPSVKIETVSAFAHRLEQNIDRGSELPRLTRWSGSMLAAALMSAIRAHAWCEGMLVALLHRIVQMLGWPQTWFCGYLNRLTPDQEMRFLDAIRQPEATQAKSGSCHGGSARTGRPTQHHEICRLSASSFGLLGGEMLDGDPNANRDQAQHPTDRAEGEEKERDKSEHQLDRKK
jgi:hypothetical protein